MRSSMRAQVDLGLASMCTQVSSRSLIARIHLPVFTDRSAISSNTGSGASVISAPRSLVSVRQARPGPAVDHHRAAAADARAADEVELQRRILLLADLVQRDEQRHAIGFLELVRLHARHAAPAPAGCGAGCGSCSMRRGRVVAPAGSRRDVARRSCVARRQRLVDALVAARRYSGSRCS